jgi:hypothetical protein
MKHTGPVMTLADLVVHVPTNCGSIAVTVEIKYALAASSDFKESEAIAMVFVRRSR